MASYEIWLKRAKSSLSLSKTVPDEFICYEDLCFQAQQAAEKSIKALLLFYDIEPVKTHNLVTLLQELMQRCSIPDKLREVVLLTDYAVQTRYPGDYSPVEKTEYLAAVKIADYCVRWIDKKIKRLSAKSDMPKLNI